MSKIMIGGSRNLPDHASRFVGKIVSAILADGDRVSVGCAAGADACALRAALGIAPSRVELFCVGGESGAGFWRGSAPLSLLRAAAAHGAAVTWRAGGPPEIPFRARLMCRSLAALSGSSAAVFFLASSGSPGSLAVASKAIAANIPVFVFVSNTSGTPDPPRDCAGFWRGSVFHGFRCFVWVPDQPSLF